MIATDLLFLDSGIGGLSYLEAYRAANPRASVAYLADTGGFPYGQRDPDWVRSRARAVVDAALRIVAPRVCVVACNTASVVALSSLRKHVPIPFVGVVPAVKPASATTKSGRIAILSTARTAVDPYTDDLVGRFAEGIVVQRIGLPGLVDAVERSACQQDRSSIRRVLSEEIAGRLAEGVDTVVLACTHFLRVRAELGDLLGPGVTIVDSLDGVVRRAAALARDGAATAPAAAATATVDGQGAPVGDHPPFLVTSPIPPHLECLTQRYNVRQISVAQPLDVG